MIFLTPSDSPCVHDLIATSNFAKVPPYVQLCGLLQHFIISCSAIPNQDYIEISHRSFSSSRFDAHICCGSGYKKSSDSARFQDSFEISVEESAVPVLCDDVLVFLGHELFVFVESLFAF